MIKQQFLFNNTEILRLYHSNFGDFPKDRFLRQGQVIDEGTITFIETWIENIEEEKIEYDLISSGFLSCQHKKNPYSTLSCHYQEFITTNKDFVKDGHIIDISWFDQVKNFIKKWSNFDLHQSPFSLYNVLTYYPTNIEIDTSLDREDDRIINMKLSENDYDNLICHAKFKRNDIIVETKILPITKSTTIKPLQEWSNIDIELFSENDIVYAYYNLSFIKSIHFDGNFVTKQVTTRLQHIDKEITLQDVSYNPMVIGKEDSELDSYNYQEQLLIRQFTHNRKFNFLTRNQYDLAIDIFSEIAETSGYKEMWIFDPFFIDYKKTGGKKRLNDIIKILGKNLRMKKHIVFYSKTEENAKEEFADFKKTIANSLIDLQKYKVKLDFQFYGSSEHFHDRFIFLKSDDKLLSYLLGTSFNSFGENYSSIVELEQFNGEKVFQSLTNNVTKTKNIVLSKDLK